MIPPVNSQTNTVGAGSPYGMFNPYGQFPQQPVLTAQASTTLASPLTTPSGLNNGLTALSTRPNPYTAANTGYQPMLYWYPSPPVSPQNQYFVQGNISTIVVKGLPYTAAVPDILTLFEGIYEQVRMMMEIIAY